MSRRSAGDRRLSRDHMRAERRDISRVLQSLTPEQWSAASLCDGWSVRDLVAHLVGWDEVLLYRSRREHVVALGKFIALYVGSLGSMRLVNRRIHRRTRHLDVDALRGEFGREDSDDLKWLFDGSNPGAHLAEYLIHRRDICWPLAIPCASPTDRVVAALDGLAQLPGVRLGARRHTRRQRVEATDATWARGRGHTRPMPAESILMLLAGRPIGSAGEVACL